MNKKIFIIGGVIVALIVIGIGGFLIFRKPSTTPGGTTTPVDCLKDPTNKACPQTPVNTSEASLTIWGVFDDSSVFQPLIDAFNKQNPNVKVTYVKKSYADYENTLVDAIASDSGPDIFAVSNFWVPKHKSKMAAANPNILSAQEFSQSFITSAYNDFVADGKVYGVPLYTDDLALIYNRKLFNKDSISDPPQNWNDVLDYSKILTKKAPGDPKTITQGGIALGTSGVTRSADILTALMLQNGTPMISDDKRSYLFNQFVKDPSGNPIYPGTSALNFYTSFANPDKASYSWNDTLGNSIDAFAQEKVAMIIGYSYFIPQIVKANPSLIYGVSPLPQIKGAPENIDFVNYWGWSVSNRSKNTDMAWTFLNFLTQRDQISNYLQATSLTSPQKNQTGGSNKVFDDQKYYSQTIFKGDADIFDQIFTSMIDDVVKFNQPNQSAIDSAARQANDMLTKFY